MLIDVLKEPKQLLMLLKGILQKTHMELGLVLKKTRCLMVKAPKGIGKRPLPQSSRERQRLRLTCTPVVSLDIDLTQDSHQCLMSQGHLNLHLTSMPLLTLQGFLGEAGAPYVGTTLHTLVAFVEQDGAHPSVSRRMRTLVVFERSHDLTRNSRTQALILWWSGVGTWWGGWRGGKGG